LAGERQISLTRRQSEARNFETVQHIDKQKPDVSSTINALKMLPNLAASPHEVLVGRKLISYK